ncbi:MAG: HlyD family efflux transporter periplasmic adaptor subunit [bacterium]|nr:HlyD family efflux transporter periplasmic adaptor subunit [bacterium]
MRTFSGSTVLKIVVGFLLFVFLVSQIYSSLINPYTTETAIYYQTHESVLASGVIIRNETVISGDTQGVKNYEIQDGQRVPKDSVIATVYEDINAVNIRSEIDKIDREIVALTAAQANSDVNSADLSMLSKKTNNCLMELLNVEQSGDLQSSLELRSELLQLLNRREIIIGSQTDFSSQINLLKSRKAELEADMPVAKSTIKAACSGYFVSSTDGYEQILSVDNIENVTVDMLQKIDQNPENQDRIGKIVTDYEWYIASAIPFESAIDFSDGMRVTIKTGLSGCETINAVVKYINRDTGSDKAVIVFSCNDMSSQLAMIRKLEIDIVTESYSGIRVNNRSIRIIDGVKGVYVLEGMQARFVPVNVLYSTDSYAICEQQIQNANVLRIYDDVIVKGKNLYDGKVIE